MKGLLKKLFLKNKILAISSAGGHLTEILYCIPESVHHIVYVTCKTPHTKSLLNNQKSYYVIDPHVSKFKYFLNFLQCIRIFLLVRPSIVISTGSGIAISMFFLAKIFGSKLIFVETGARISTPSKTGKLLYKISDLFIVQHEKLLIHFPKAKLGVLV